MPHAIEPSVDYEQIIKHLDEWAKSKGEQNWKDYISSHEVSLDNGTIKNPSLEVILGVMGYEHLDSGAGTVSARFLHALCIQASIHRQEKSKSEHLKIDCIVKKLSKHLDKYSWEDISQKEEALQELEAIEAQVKMNDAK